MFALLIYSPRASTHLLKDNFNPLFLLKGKFFSAMWINEHKKKLRETSYFMIISHKNFYLVSKKKRVCDWWKISSCQNEQLQNVPTPFSFAGKKWEKTTWIEMEIYSPMFCGNTWKFFQWILKARKIYFSDEMKNFLFSMLKKRKNLNFSILTSWALKYSSSPQCMSCSSGFTTWCSQSSLTQAISMIAQFFFVTF